MGLGVEGLGLRVGGLGFEGVWGLGFWGLGFQGLSSGMKAFGGLGELKLRLCTMEKFKLKRSHMGRG